MLTALFVQHAGVDAIVESKTGDRHTWSASRHCQLLLEINRVIATA
jgi:hypothetical protein